MCMCKLGAQLARPPGNVSHAAGGLGYILIQNEFSISTSVTASLEHIAVRKRVLSCYLLIDDLGGACRALHAAGNRRGLHARRRVDLPSDT